MAEAKNVLGDTLEVCCTSPMTGFYRTGTCETGPQDAGTHVECAQVTEEFLVFSRSRGNDLITPAPEHGFPGLKPGDRWCLCATRCREALEAVVAPGAPPASGTDGAALQAQVKALRGRRLPPVPRLLLVLIKRVYPRRL